MNTANQPQPEPGAYTRSQTGKHGLALTCFQSPASRLRAKNRRTAQTSPRFLLTLLALILLPAFLIASAPQWWTDLGVLDSSASANDYAAINQGQLKNLATKAYWHLQTNLPANTWTNSPGTALTALIASFNTNSAYNYNAVNLGQLKTVAKPFYDVLNTVGYTNTAVASPYPWSSSTTTANDYAMANIGQAKNLFSFDLANFTYIDYSVPPSAPTNLTVTSLSPTELQLTWTNTANNATSILVQKQNADGTWTTVATLDPKATFYSLSGLTTGQNVTLQVVSSNGAGSSSSGSSDPVHPKPTPRYAVIDLGQDWQPTGMNNSGVVVGFNNLQAGIWEKGSWKTLPVPVSPDGSQGGWAFDINDNGEISGGVVWIEDDGYGNYSHAPTQAVKWPDEDTSPLLLGFIGIGSVENSFSFGISNTGSCVGSDGYSGFNYPVQFSGGQCTKLMTDFYPEYLYPLLLKYTATKMKGTHWIGSYTFDGLTEPDGDYYEEIGGLFDGQRYPGMTLYSVNESGIVIGIDSNSNPIVLGSDITLSGGIPLALNNRQTTDEEGVSSPSPQFIGSTADSTPLLWEKINEDGTPSATYISKNINELIPSDSGYSVMINSQVGLNIVFPVSKRSNVINDSGMILAAATYSGTDSSIAAGPHAVLLLPAELAVDANRDGKVVLANDANNPNNVDSSGKQLPIDTTSDAKPYRFWINEDQDDSDTAGIENLASYNGVTAPYNAPNSSTDYKTGTIHTKRNLEDFARLCIYVGGLQDAIKSGTLSVALKWENVTDSPAINVYKAVETDGGSQYLTDDGTAAQQIADDDHNKTKGKITGTNSVVLDSSLFANLSTTNSTTYCLFEGAGVGKGKLVIVFKDASGKEIGEGGALYLDIKHVTDMYEQVVGTAPTEPIPQPAAADSPATVTAALNLQTSVVPWSAYTTNFTADASETSDTIVWVHGWNVYPARYEQQTQAMFKRLWWVGFKGRFCSFHWPSTNGATDEWPSIIRTAANAALFDQIEYRAYKYAGGLKNYITQKAGNGSVYVIAHSLGGVVTSEACKLGAPITKLELMDAAVSASCYDVDTTHYQAATSASDPDLSYHTDGSINGGYRGYFQSLPVGSIVNFYNVKDSGLAAWNINNSNLTKGGTAYPGNPIVQPGGGFYYNPTTSNVWRYLYGGNANPKYNRAVPDLHESMSFMALSRSGPLGFEPNVTGPIGTPINMRDYFGTEEDGHSPQMDHNIQSSEVPFFKRIMKEAGLPTFANP